MEKKLLRVMILTIFSLIIVNALAFAVPMTINYQGKLTDPNGNVLNGEYQMSFSLFNTDTNGTALWSEQQTVTVINGIYNVGLGAVNPLTASIFNNDNIYLEVGIESEILLPRHKLTSVAFAIRAIEAETVAGFPVEDLVTETEFDNKITTHVFTDVQIPDDITINYSATSGDANTLDGKDSTEFGDGHSMDAADGDPVDVLYVDNSGNVGIGTTSPVSKLDVKGNIHASDTIISGNSITINGVNDKIVATSGTIDFDDENLITTGNVGIGTASPAAKLEVNGAILRSGSTMHGANANTHINLGVNSNTGRYGQDISHATVSGGLSNLASYDCATVSGGRENIADSLGATVSGGGYNTAGSTVATVSGGSRNTASGYCSTVSGGVMNTASGWNATVGGGELNTASGRNATVPGGNGNTAAGEYSFAAGFAARASHQGTFVWADSTNAYFDSTGNNQFLIRASGGVGIGTTSPNQEKNVKLDVKQGNAEFGDILIGYLESGKPGNGNYIGLARNDDINFTEEIDMNWHSIRDVEKLNAIRMDAKELNAIKIFGLKFFKIDHPLYENKYLIHACIEGSEIGVYYRGRGKLVNGCAKVELPEYFNALTRDDSYTVLLTAKGKVPFALSYDEFNEKSFVVYGSIEDGEFDWEVKAVRADTEPLQAEPDK